MNDLLQYIISMRKNPEKRKKIVSSVKASTKWWEPWKRSARKAQIAVKKYKDTWWTYSWAKSSSNSLVKWTKQEWWTKSWKPSSVTWERYLPKKAIKALSPAQYSATSKAKRAWGWTWKTVKQPKKIASITKIYR